MASVPGRLPAGLNEADFGPAVPLDGGTSTPRYRAARVQTGGGALPRGLNPADFGPAIDTAPVRLDGSPVDTDQLYSAMTRSRGISPDHVADVFKVSRKTGLDIGTVERNLPEARGLAEVEPERIEAFAQRNPRAASWLAQPGNYGLAKDDLDTLGGLEQAFTRNNSTGMEPEEEGGVGSSLLKTVKRTIPTVGGSLYDMYGLGLGGLDYIERGLGDALGTGSTGVFGKARDYMLGQSNAIAENILSRPELSLPPSKQGRLWDNPRLLLDPEWLTFNVGDAANSMLPTIASLFASGGTTAVPAVIGAAQEAGGLYRDLITKDKADPSRALSASLAYGVVVSQLEKLGLDKIMDKRVAGTVAKRIAKATVAGATEGGTEYLEEPFQAFFQGMANNESPDQVTARVADALKNVEVIPGSFLLGGAGAYGNTAREYQKAKAAQRMGAAFDEIGKFSSESKLNARLPEAYQDYVEHVRRETGGAIPEKVYVSAQRLAEAVMETGANGSDGSTQADANVLAQFFQSIGVKPEEAQRMATLNQDVAIPFALYQSKIAPTEMGQSLANDLRFTPDGMTRNEAVQFDQEFQGRVRDELAAQERNRAQHDADLAQAIGEYKGELQRVGIKGEDADMTLQLLSGGANVAAARWSAITGEAVTPAQWLREMRGLQIRAMEQGQAQQKANLEQSIAHAGADLTNPEQVAEARRLWAEKGVESPYFKKWFGDSKVVGPDGKPLVVYHGTGRNYGNRGELISGDVESFNPGLSGKSSKTGAPEGTFFFTDSPEVASSYTVKWQGDFSEQYKDNANVMPLYLNIKKPLKVSARGENWRDILYKGEYRDINEIATMARESGKYDGVIITRVVDHGVGKTSGKPSTTYIAFDPTQIKSVFNRGTFDPNDPRILFQSAFHGSPYRFDKFTLDHIGEGEGAQAYGWGLYFAGNKEVSEWYREKLTKDRETELWTDELRAQLPEALSTDQIKEMSTLSQKMGREGNLPASEMARWKELKAAQSEYEAAVDRLRPKGQLYEVTIPDDDTMLDWDKPLSEQPEQVKKAILTNVFSVRTIKNDTSWGAYWDMRSLPGVSEGTVELKGGKYQAFALDGSWNAGTFKSESAALRAAEKKMREQFLSKTGKNLYQSLKNGNARAASEYLKSIGIPGLRYLDGTSRGKGEGHHNYVVFDDAQIAIDKTYYQGSLGSIAFTDQGTFINLFKGASDRSTLPHEFAHLFVNDMQAMLATGKAPESVVRDLASLEKFAGDLATVDAQEKIARAFEAYLREGKAPSPELRTAFQTFRAWLTAIYRDIRALIGPSDMNDELRGVFDRMLASEDEIAQAEAYYGAKDAMETVAADMLTDAEKKRITELRGQSHAEALEKRTRRYVSAYLKALGGKAEFERQAGEEVDAQPTYANVKDIAENGGLPRAALDELIGREPAQALFLKFPGLVSTRAASLFGANDLDLIAAAHDYQSAEAMIADFQKAKTRGAAVRELTTAKMEAEESRLREALANETVSGDEDVHSNETLERLTTEALALERKIRTDAGAKAAVSRPVNAAASREVARGVLSTMTVSEARDYSRFAAAERRAGLAVAQALKAQKWQEALDAKQREAINHALVLESVKLREEVAKELSFARRVGNSKSMRFDAKEQALSVIQAYGLGTEKMRPERPEELADLAEYLKAAFEDDLFNPFDAFPDWLLRKEKAGQYRDLSVTDFREVAYLMRNLADVGGSAAVHMATEDVSYEAKASELAEAIRKSGNVVKKFDEGTRKQKAVHTFRAIMSTLQQQLDMFRKADGYMNLGPEKSHLVGPNQEMFERIQKATKRMLGMQQALEPAMKEVAAVRQAFVDRFRKTYGERPAVVNGVTVPDIMQDADRFSWTAERIWCLARNIGNGGNRRCLIEGLGLEWPEIQNLLRVLTKDELLAVQREGQIIGSHYADADKTYRQVYNRPMAQRIEYLPMVIQAADGPVRLDGWYFPIKPDARLNQRSADRENADIMKADAASSAFPPNPRKSFTNARTGAAVPVALSFDVFERGIAEQTRFIAMAPILKDADRVFRQDEYRKAYTNAFGREAYDEIRPWLKNIATPGLEQRDAYDDWLSKQRRASTAFILIGNLKSALKQELGIFPAMKEMGASWALRGMKALAVDGGLTVDAINAMDPRMKNREKGFDTEQRELLAKARNDTVKLAFGKIDTRVTERDVLNFGMTLQRLFDRHTTYSVWAGAFLKGRDGLGMTEQEAADYAYRMVERTQVTNTDAAMNALQRGKSWVRLFSMFMSEALPKGSRVRVDFNAFRTGKIGAAEYARSVFYELIGPVLFNVVGLNLLASVSPDDPSEYFWSFWNELFGTLPFLSSVSGYFMYNQGPSESPVFTGVEAQLKAAQKAFALTRDFDNEEAQAAFLKALIDVAAYRYHVGNVRRFYETAAEGFKDISEGETRNPFRLVIKKPKGRE